MAVVVGYVPTPEGRAALRWAATEAGLRRVRLVVVGPPRRADQGASAGTADDDPDLRSAMAELAAAGVDVEVRPAGPGPEPADEVLDAAEGAGAEVIVIGLRRRTPVGKLLLGSNAQRILLDAACPVIAVKADPAR